MGTMNHYCPACHSTHGFKLQENIETRIQCTSCGHIFQLDAVLRLCPICVDRTPHVQHKRDGKFHEENVFAYTCLVCGRYTEVE